MCTMLHIFLHKSVTFFLSPFYLRFCIPSGTKYHQRNAGKKVLIFVLVLSFSYRDVDRRERERANERNSERALHLWKFSGEGKIEKKKIKEPTAGINS